MLSAAVLIMAPWVQDPPKVSDLLGDTGSESDFEKLTGTYDPQETIDAVIVKQQARRKETP